ncbi:MAG: hypothetical protein H0T62_12815 [Parachlamydiaceae bacterium]|nr:hypothetical protein [Parachlamydiaceae bacterium]
MDTFEENFEETEPSSYIANAEEHLILMHRDAHFGGSFETMIQYYEEEGKGVVSEFDLNLIRQLCEIEKRTGNNLAIQILSGADAEKVSEVRKAYKSLKSLYEEENPKNIGPRLIADLILSEEELPEQEIAAIVKQKALLVPLLIDLVRSEKFYDPLFPGYGQAPSLAAHCLGLIGDKRAMFSLFEAIGETNFFSEDTLLDSLKHIGEPAKNFLLKVVQSDPINYDNERAAIALVRFKEDPEVSSTCLKMLLKPHVWKDSVLTLHLILVCEGLQDLREQQQFSALADNPAFPKSLVQDIKVIAKKFG